MGANRSSSTLRHMILNTRELTAAPDGIAAATDLLRRGGLVAIPTETVYGLAGDACNGEAVARIYQAKGRPQFNPLIAHVADIEMAKRYAHFDARAEAVAQASWPGPLTLVLPLREDAGISPLVTAGLSTLAIRCPAHPVAQAVISAYGSPLAAPSANPSGRVSPTKAAHVMAGLNGKIDAVIDGGACEVGLESTILGLDTAEPKLLRPGGLSLEALEAVLGPIGHGGSATTPNAPGQLLSHYAPEAGVRLNVTEPHAGEVWVGFGPACAGAPLSLSPSGDLVEAAAGLFQMLRDADALAGPEGRIAFAPIPTEGLGLAINDRLGRAAAPRDQ